MSLAILRQPLRTLLRRLLDCAIAVAIIALAPGCGADKATGPSGSTLAAEFAVTSDSLVILGGTLPIIVKGSLATLPPTLHITWTSSDPSVATVDNAGKVTGVGIGTVRISARLLGQDLDTGVVRSLDFRVKYKGISIAAIDSLTGLGQTVTPVVQGLDTTGVARGAVVATLTSADPSIASVASSTITAVKNGSTTITAAFDGSSAQTTVKVRQVAKSFSFASTPLVFRSLERDTTIALTIRDTRDNLMTATATWVSADPAIASVSGAGVLRAHQASATSFRVTVDTVSATLPVSVAQVIASISKVAGDGQSVVAGATVPIAPSVVVKDAGGVGIAGVSVTFAVQTGGGSVIGATAITSASGVATVGSWTLGNAAGANSLTATVGSLSQSFAATGTAGTAVRVHFTSSPGGTVTNLVGATLAPAVSVSVVDANDNVITGSSASVNLSLVGPGGVTPLVGTTVLNTTSGVAAFGALKVSTPSAGYQLIASASGLASDTTAAFTVLGPPSRLAFVDQPTSGIASTTLAGVTVAVQDAAGTTLTSATNSVTLSLASNPGGATLTGGTARAASAGVASFSSLKLNRAGTGYTLAATATGLTSATSSAFNITAGSANGLAFVVAPTNVANAVAMSPSVQVAVVDADNNPVTSATGTITASIATGTGATISNATAPITNGIATFSALTLTGTPGSFTLNFTDGTRSLNSGTILLRAGAANALAFGTTPASTAVNGTALAPQPVVRVVDVSGNTVTSATGTITTTISAGSGGTLSGATASIASGVATFTALTLSGTAGSFTLQFSDGTRTITSPVALGASAASALAFEVAPSASATNAVPLAVQPVVRVVDASGNTVTSATGTMTATIASGTGGLLVSSTAAITSGVATFSGLTLNGVPGPFTIRFSDGTRNVTSTTITLGVGAPSALSITTAVPATSVTGAVLSPQPVVKVVDASGNTVTTATGTMTASIASGTGGSVTGETTSIVAGVATFTNLVVSGPSGSFTLQFSDGTRTVTSSAVVLANPANVVLANTLSTAATNGLALSVQPIVKVVDGNGVTVPSATGTMTASIVSGTGGVLLNATAPITAGIATFTSLELRGLAGNFTLQFSDGTRTVNAPSIALGVGAASSLALTTAPSTTGTNGTALATQPVVAVRDVGGNVVTSASGTATATIASGTGSVLTGGSATITNGVATFSGLTFTGAAGTFTLQFSDGTRTVTSSSIAIGAGAANSIIFAPGTAPSASATVGVALPVQPVLQVLDASGNIVTSTTGTMTASILLGTGGTLVNATAPITAGVATFTNLGLNGTPGPFVLQFSDGTRTVNSVAITLAAGAPSSIVLLTAPNATTVNGVAFTTQPVVKLLDVSGNLSTSATGTITASVASGPGATLVNPTATISGGMATFSGLTLNGAIGNYTLRFSDGAISVTSGTISLGGGAESKIVFDVVPSLTATNAIPLATQPVARVVDAGGVTVNVSGTMTVTVATGTGTVANNTAPIVAGVATFSSLTLNGTPGPFTLEFSDGTVSVTAGTFVLSAGAPVGLDITAAPSTAVDGVPFSTQPSVRVVDVDAATVTSATGTMTATIVSGSGAVLSNATTPIVNGIATFSGLELTGPIGSYSIRFSDGTRTSSTVPITLTVGAPSTIQITTAPSSTGTVGVALATQPVVKVRDVGGNVVTSASGTMTATIASGTGGALTGATATITSGVATFSNLTFSSGSGPYTLQFSDGTRTTTSSTINLP